MGEGKGFSVLQARRGGRDAIILVDTALDPSRLAARFPYLLTLTLPIRNANPRGLCDDAESERLSDLEDGLLAALDPAAYRYAGRITWNGVREVLVYVSDAEASARRLAAAAATAAPDEAVEVSVEREPGWETYRKIVR